MAEDWLPRADGEFHAWQENFVTYANANLAGLGLVAGVMTPVTGAQTIWKRAYPAHVAAQAAAQNATQRKGEGDEEEPEQRVSYEAVSRPMVARLQSSAVVSDAERASLAITVRDRTRSPVAAPTSRPVVSVDADQRLRHTINFADEASPTRKAKPAGVNGAEVWVKIGGPPPTDPKECVFLALDTRTPYLAEFDGADGGKVAHYMLRWVSTRGEAGPWSETASATIGA